MLLCLQRGRKNAPLRFANNVSLLNYFQKMFLKNIHVRTCFQDIQKIKIPYGKRNQSTNEKKELLKNINTFIDLEGHEAHLDQLVDQLMPHTSSFSSCASSF